MITTDPRYEEAMTNLDRTGSAMAIGASIAPDFVMRSIIAFRTVLQEHAPQDGRGRRCASCCNYWPCATAEPVLIALGVEEPDE